MEEVGTFEQLSSNENSRFSAFLKTMAETSTATTTVDQTISADVDVAEAGDGQEGDEDALEYGGDEPDVTKVIHDSPKRGSSSSADLVRRLSSNVQDSSAKLGDSNGALMTDEFKERSKGSVDHQVYIAWAKAGGGVYAGVLILAMFVVVEALTVTSKWWLTYWSQSGGNHAFFYLSIYALVNFSAM